ncbi:PDR/VanB family oxidoreductase [Saccharothrix syringae]|uniref:Oxidoreductase n=1 Tax=Saccharothrix syringae TaxID=103733 RepID=A0A5Q0GXS5_SACSY|nr:PDR/VanB family oxidoreductase [Saccharothrix syringae]QFZ18290.1 oxidoreductase [Saccharothrix syringae]
MSWLPELRLVVADRTDLTPTVRRFALRRPDGGPLPGYEPGAHVTLTTPAGHRRSYSLVEPGGEAPGEYVVCVRRDPAGRGGSASMHDDVVVGTGLTATGPRNRFPLLPAKRYLFIAGGIGITPIRSMATRLRAEGCADLRLLYLTRTAEDAPFLDEFPDATAHHSAGRGRLDLWPHLATPDDDTRVYCCGPLPLIRSVRALTAHWRPSRVHVEEFTAPDGYAAPFTAVWAPTGRRVDVPANRSLLSALRGAGVAVDSSCEAGTCGTCRLAVLDGGVEHRDAALTDEERRASLLSCVSRAAAEEITVGPVTG